VSEPPGVEWVPVESLIPWTRNPKPHSTENVAAIAHEIVRHGFADPIVAWRSRRWIAAGHGRHAAVSLLYREDAGRLIATDQIGKGTVLVRWIEFASEGEFQAYAIANNRLTEANPMDQEQVADILRELAEQGTPIDDLGYTQDDLQILLAEPEVEPSADDDEAPEPPAEPVSRLGEVYELGPHRLVCGDSTSAESWALLMGDERGDLVFTDPPYGVAYEGGHNEKKRKQIANDALEGADLTGLFHDSLAMAIGYSHNHAAFYVWYASGKSIETYAAFSKLPLKLRAVIQWYKVRSGLGAFMSQYIPNCEPCIYAFKDGHSPQWFGPSDEKTVWELQREGKNEYHPTQKPVALSVREITNSSKPGQIVIDMFGGSGATLIGSGLTGRICRMMEIDPKFCDVIRRRWTAWAKQNNRPVGTGGLE
jgi:DNA modification methylase